MDAKSNFLRRLFCKKVYDTELLYSYDLVTSCMALISFNSKVDALGRHSFRINKVKGIEHTFEEQIISVLSNLILVFKKYGRPLPELVLFHLKEIMKTNDEINGAIGIALMALDRGIKKPFGVTLEKYKEAYEYLYFRQNLFFLLEPDDNHTINDEILLLKDEVSAICKYHKSFEVIKRRWIKMYRIIPKEVDRQHLFTIGDFLSTYRDLFKKYEDYLIKIKGDYKLINHDSSIRLDKIRMIMCEGDDYDIKKSFFYLHKYRKQQSLFEKVSSPDYQEQINKTILGDFYEHFSLETN